MKEKLLNIQAELKAPKNQTNKFGGYKYRSCEDILEAVKPLLLKYKTTLTIEDSIELVGEHLFMKSTATLRDCETDHEITNVAYAEMSEHKGMSSEQCTGTASSYCRKYCLNGLFLIDDTKDLDTEEFVKQTTEEKATKEQIDYIKEMLATGDFDEADIKDYLRDCNKKKLSDLSKKEAAKLIGE